MAVAFDLGNYTPISDYNSLLDNVRRWLDRGNELDQLLPTFVSLAESYLNRTLRTPEMEAVTAPATLAGAFILPLDCLAIRSLSCSGRPLDCVSPSALADTYSGVGGYLPGFPAAYAITGRQVQVAPLSSAPVRLTYWQRIPPLGLNAPVNWLLSSHADIYLYGTLAAATDYIDDPDRLAKWTAAFEGLVQQLAVAGDKARWAGPLIARSRVAQVSGAPC